MKTTGKSRLFFLGFLVLLALSLPSVVYSSYTRQVFDELVNAIKNKATKIDLLSLEEKYKGKRLEGKAYIQSITKDIDDNYVITFSTTQEADDENAVTVTVYVVGYFAERTLKRLKVGDYIRIFGRFREIRMQALVIDEGILKKF